MPLKMMDADDGLAERKAERVGDTGADEQCASQAWPARMRDHVDFLLGTALLVQYLLKQRQGAADVIARGEFRHDPAVSLMHVNLRMQRMGEQTLFGAIVKGQPGFIA